MLPTTFQFPLDSLYKFLALSGVVLLVTSIIVPLRLFYDLRIRELQFAIESAEGKAKYESWIAAEIRLQKRYEKHEINTEWLRQFIEKNPHQTAPEDMKKFQSEFAKGLDQDSSNFDSEAAKNIERAAQADAAIASVKAKVKELDFLKWTANASLILFGLLFLVSAGMTWRGFWLWQTRVQNHQDAILAADAAAKTAKPVYHPHGNI